MKTMFSFTGAIVVIICMCLSIPAVEAQVSNTLEVVAAAICTDVVDREAVDVGNSFSTSVPRLYCFTKIVGANQPTEVVHVWSYGDMERARVSLAVNASAFCVPIGTGGRKDRRKSSSCQPTPPSWRNFRPPGRPLT